MTNTFETFYLKHLFDQVKTKITDYVNVSGSPENEVHEHNNITNLINWDVPNNYRYLSISTINPFIVYEFKQKTPYFTSYTIETHKDGAKSFPTEWDVKGTNDLNNDEWEILDYRDNISSLNTFNKTHKFSMKTNNYKYIKFTQYKNIFDKAEYNNTFAIKKIDFNFFLCSIPSKNKIPINSKYFLIALLN